MPLPKDYQWSSEQKARIAAGMGLTKCKIRRITSLGLKGFSSRKIGKILGISRRTVVKYAHLNDVPLKYAKSYRQLPKRIVRQLIELRKVGKTQEQIAEILGIDQGTVSNYTRKILGTHTHCYWGKFWWNNISESRREQRIRNSLMKSHIRPTGPEQEFITMIQNYGLPLRYVGDGELLIDGRNPDFIHQTERKIIEIFGRGWHLPNRWFMVSPKRTVLETMEFYKSRGYDCLILWDNEIHNTMVILKKVRKFLGGDMPD